MTKKNNEKLTIVTAKSVWIDGRKKAGERVEIDKGDIKDFVKGELIAYNRMKTSELYSIAQALDIDGRSKIEDDNLALIKVIKEQFKEKKATRRRG